MTEQPIRVPEYFERPQRVEQLWILRKGRRRAVCELWTHPLTAEVRCDVGGELIRSEAAGRDALALIDLATAWRGQFLEKGWIL